MINTWHTFNNHGYIYAKAPQDILDKFESYYEGIKNGSLVVPSFNHRLAGQLANEHLLDGFIPEVQDYFNSVADEYVKFFNVSTEPKELYNNGKKWDIKLGSLWMNIQKKHEYNPVHSHSGVLSFALWLKVPYSLEEEQSLPNSVNANGKANADFYFCPINTVGELVNIPMNVDKNKEGALVIFMSRLQHYVNPFFTSDDDRVSISGNFYYKERGTK